MVMYVRKLSLASLVRLHSYIGAAPIGLFGEYCKHLVNELLTDLPDLQTSIEMTKFKSGVLMMLLMKCSSH